MTKSKDNNRILIILDTNSGQIGGTEQNSVHFSRALISRGYDPLLIETGPSILLKSGIADGLKTHNIPCDYFGNITKPVWSELLKNTKPLVVVRAKGWSGCMNLHLDLAVKLAGVCYLSWEHHTAFDPRPYWPKNLRAQIRLKLLTWFHFKATKRTLAVSNAVRDPLTEFFPLSSKSIDVIYPGVDFNFFSHSAIARQQLRNQWGIPENAFVIGSLGRLVEHKGNDFTLKIAAKLRHIAPNLNLWCVFAGKGPDQDRLKNLTTALGLDEQVRFPGWQESAPNAWSALDLFIMPSADEGLGMTLIEAVACGCLSIGTTAGGMKEILSGPLTEYGLPPEIDLWADKILEIANLNPENKALRQLCAYNTLKEKFSATIQWNKMVDWMESKI